MDDLISRQAAIEIASGFCHPANIAKELAKLPSAQPEKHTQERTETHACDLIDRQAAIDALIGITTFKTKHELMQRVNASVQDEQGWLGAVAECLDEIEDLPSAQPDMSEYSDKLWKAAYERGKAEAQPDLDEVYAHAETEAEARYHAERKKGKWINVRHDNIAECDQCGITGRAWMNFCFDCGADMRAERRTDDR